MSALTPITPDHSPSVNPLPTQRDSSFFPWVVVLLGGTGLGLGVIAGLIQFHVIAPVLKLPGGIGTLSPKFIEYMSLAVSSTTELAMLMGILYAFCASSKKDTPPPPIAESSDKPSNDRVKLYWLNDDSNKLVEIEDGDDIKKEVLVYCALPPRKKPIQPAEPLPTPKKEPLQSDASKSVQKETQATISEIHHFNLGKNKAILYGIYAQNRGLDEQRNPIIEKLKLCASCDPTLLSEALNELLKDTDIDVALKISDSIIISARYFYHINRGSGVPLSDETPHISVFLNRPQPNTSRETLMLNTVTSSQWAYVILGSPTTLNSCSGSELSVLAGKDEKSFTPEKAISAIESALSKKTGEKDRSLITISLIDDQKKSTTEDGPTQQGA